MKKPEWNRILSKIFPLPFWADFTAFLACGAGLIWVFVNGREAWLPAYFLYALSAYLLTALCVKIPGILASAKDWEQRHPKLSAALKNQELKFKLELYTEQFINFAYGIFKILSGVIVGSAWIGCDGIYNLAQALIQLFQILRRRNPGSIRSQWSSYRFCGVLILLMHLTLIATAAFAFYKFIASFIDLAKDRKHAHPIDSSVRMLELSQAIFAMFSLQAGLLHTFGSGESWEHWLNLATGCAVCLLVCTTGVYMILRGSRELKKLQENGNG